MTFDVKNLFSTLENRRIFDDGTVNYSADGLVEFLYSGLAATNLELDLFDSEVAKFLTTIKEECDEFEVKNPAKLWFFPEEYQTLNLEEFFLSLCTSDNERMRIIEELRLFQEKNMEMLLRYLIWMTVHLREKKVWWGVGRGSSCASYCLYLIGLHKVNSLEYKLDIKEFLK